VGGTSNAAGGRAAAERRAATAAAAAAGGPRSAGSMDRRPNPPNTELRRHYERSDLPVIIVQGARNKLSWKADPAGLDFHNYLPLFMSGIREVEEPYQCVGRAGGRGRQGGGGAEGWGSTSSQ
jgi:hypothetical protein